MWLGELASAGPPLAVWPPRRLPPGILVSPGEFYGPDGSSHVRVAVVQPTARLDLAARRLGALSL